MRKTTLLLFGLFTLFACSEDVIQEMDEQTTGLEETPGPNSGDSGGNTVFTFDDSDPGWIDILNGYAIHPYAAPPKTYNFLGGFKI